MNRRAISLSTDLYELTMAAAYYQNNVHEETAIFELFVRNMPPARSYLVSAGLEQALAFLSTVRLSGEEIDYLRLHPSFKQVEPRFFEYLREFKFSGDVWAVPEGTVVFPGEPLLRVTAPIIQAQIAETFLLSTINFQTLIASKAARVTVAAQGRRIIEFGTRRAHGSEAGLLAARAAYIGGCAGTSNVEAGHLFGILTFGTLAHSFVMAFEREDDAFRSFLKVFPESATILLDTYDTIAAVKRLVDFNVPIPAVRLDSGDLLELSRSVRQILDNKGFESTRIFASGDLDEYKIADLIAQNAPIDAFGVGTQLATSYDAPALGGVYKLVGQLKEGRIRHVIKTSPDKLTYPGPKQVWRQSGSDGRYKSDVLAFADEEQPYDAASPESTWRPLLEPVMTSGRASNEYVSLPPSASSIEPDIDTVRNASRALLDGSRARAAEQLSRLHPELLSLQTTTEYPVGLSDRLKSEVEKLERDLMDRPTAVSLITHQELPDGID